MNKIKVLLADNHALYREGARSVIEQEPDIKVVGEAGDSAEAIRLAGEKLPHVVLVDIDMPRMSGIEITRRIKAACPTAAILILTADEKERQMVDLLEAGAAGYLLKSISGEDLVDAIHAVNAGEAVLHPAIAQKIFSRLGANEQEHKQKSRETYLSEREMEILTLAASGLSNQDIALHLFLSHRTVQAHLANIFRKLGVGSRTDAVLEAMRKGWIGLDDL